MSTDFPSHPNPILNLDSLFPKLPNHLFVFSHLRWDFVYQRPQHLLTRFAADFKVVFFEEPVFCTECETYYEQIIVTDNIIKIIPRIAKCEGIDIVELQKQLFDNYMINLSPEDVVFWYYTPMALEFTRQYKPRIVIYDCMDELSAFKFAPPHLKILEQELMQNADIVFTGGNSLYEAKKNQHKNISAFPSSIDADHFSIARNLNFSPPDQIHTTQPKLGFYGVIDERFDIELIQGIAELRPDWQIILIGPVVKIDPAILPKHRNIHYLGPKNYKELPLYISSWNIALIPFLLNESTRFISPTKTPEYLAAGLPVISTPIKDVVMPYGEMGLVHIGKNAIDFVVAAEGEFALSDLNKQNWRHSVHKFLEHNSWDNTYSKMINTIKNHIVINKDALTKANF